MAQYAYTFVSLTTQTVIGALPLQGVSFNRPLNAPGALSGQVPLGDPRIGSLDPIGTTSPSKVALYVDRDGVLIWGGIVWARSYDSTARALTISAAEFESYFARRLITATYAPAGIDQCTIAQALITAAQAATGGNVGVVVGTQTSGVLRSFTWNGYELKTVQTALKDIGQQAGGFDWSFDPAYIAGAPRTTFNTFYPARGTANAVNGLLFELPGNVVSYTLPEDGSAIDVTSYMTGSGSGASQIQTSATSGTLLGFGYPLLESASSDSSIVDLTTLGNAASARQSAANNPVSLLTLVVRADQDPVLGSYGPGDEIRVRITDARWPAPQAGGAGLEMLARITDVKITPPDGSTAESVTITANVSPALPGVPFVVRTGVT